MLRQDQQPLYISVTELVVAELVEASKYRSVKATHNTIHRKNTERGHFWLKNANFALNKNL